MYDKNLMTLQERNITLNDRIGVSGQTPTAEWTTFKKKINQDLQELSRAIKTIAAGQTLYMLRLKASSVPRNCT